MPAHRRVAKISVSIPRELATAVRKRVGARGLSGFVAQALTHELEREKAYKFLSDLDVTYGPVSQTVIAGSQVTLSVSADGYPKPLSYEWRRQTTPLSTNETDATTDFFTFTAAPTNTTSNYRAVVRNLAHLNPGIPSNLAAITTVSDFDRDGMADFWEVASGLNEGDVVITSVTVPNAKPGAPAANPFGGGQRRF